MLYVGTKVELSGYVRRDASPATARGSIPGCQQTTACPWVSIPRRPARPVSWVYSRGDVSVSLAIVFDEFFQHDGTSWHIDAQGEGLGSDDDLE